MHLIFPSEGRHISHDINIIDDWNTDLDSNGQGTMNHEYLRSNNGCAPVAVRLWLRVLNQGGISG